MKLIIQEDLHKEFSSDIHTDVECNIFLNDYGLSKAIFLEVNDRTYKIPIEVFTGILSVKGGTDNENK